MGSDTAAGDEAVSVDLVCLCDQYDLKAEFSSGFEAVAPWINVLAPSDVRDPASIQYAMVFRPGLRAFEPYPRLRLLCSVGAGVEALIAHPALTPEMAITRMVDADVARSIAAFALWHVIGWQRQMHRYREQQAERVWKEIPFAPASEFPVAVLGYGNIGRAACGALAQLGFPVTGFATAPKAQAPVPIVSGRAALETLLQESRAVVNLLPLTPATERILSFHLLSAMRDDAILVHLGRGGHLVESDLCRALDAGRPAYAAIDVTAVEPTPKDHRFWSHPRISLTPHAAGVATPQAVASSIARDIRCFQKGEMPPGVVERGRGY